jgi:hypothetical protein
MHAFLLDCRDKCSKCKDLFIHSPSKYALKQGLDEAEK